MREWHLMHKPHHDRHVTSVLAFRRAMICVYKLQRIEEVASYKSVSPYPTARQMQLRCVIKGHSCLASFSVRF